MYSTNNKSDADSKVFQFRLKHFLWAVVVVALLAIPIYQQLNNLGHSDWLRGSPFTGVWIDGDTVEVEFEDARYRLVSINDVSTQAILRSARHRYGWFGDKRFREDLPQVLSGMGMEPRPTVSLVMRNMQGEEIRVDEAFVTAENRARVYLNEK